MTVEDADHEGITVKTVIANCDVPSAGKEKRDTRGGLASKVVMWKACGAAAAKEWDLDKVVGVAQKAMGNTLSIGIIPTLCITPSMGEPDFEIELGNNKSGTGHGTPGMSVTKLAIAVEWAASSHGTVLMDLPFERGDELVVLVSGLGATPLMQIYTFFYEVAAFLSGEKGVPTHCPYVCVWGL